MSQDIKVYNVSDDGTETEIKGIISVNISRVSRGNLITASIEFSDIYLDMMAEDSNWCYKE